ncbi:MAG: sigma 54-interacting transcriptional regulator, partial [Myxococcota bacterium]
MTTTAQLLGDVIRACRARLSDEGDESWPYVEPPYEAPRPPDIIGSSRAMRRIYGLIAQVAPSNATVLLRGESGTGKELVAQAVHQASDRADR